MFSAEFSQLEFAAADSRCAYDTLTALNNLLSNVQATDKQSGLHISALAPAAAGVASVTYGLAANPCKPCPSGLTITSSSATGLTDSTSGGITDAAACVTQAGWGWDGRISTECPKGSWAVGGDLSPCTECGFGQTTANTGSVSVAACALAEGYGAVSGVIQLCPIGEFQQDCFGVGILAVRST